MLAETMENQTSEIVDQIEEEFSGFLKCLQLYPPYIFYFDEYFFIRFNY